MYTAIEVKSELVCIALLDTKTTWKLEKVIYTV